MSYSEIDRLTITPSGGAGIVPYDDPAYTLDRISSYCTIAPTTSASGNYYLKVYIKGTGTGGAWSHVASTAIETHAGWDMSKFGTLEFAATNVQYVKIVGVRYIPSIDPGYIEYSAEAVEFDFGVNKYLGKVEISWRVFGSSPTFYFAIDEAYFYVNSVDSDVIIEDVTVSEPSLTISISSNLQDIQLLGDFFIFNRPIKITEYCNLSEDVIVSRPEKREDNVSIAESIEFSPTITTRYRAKIKQHVLKVELRR